MVATFPHTGTAVLPAFRPLTTARLVLRALEPGDAGAMFAIFGDPETMRYWSHLPHRTPAETEAKLAGLIADTGDHRTWAITRDGGAFLGWVALFGPDALQIKLGYVLLPAARGQGLAEEAAQAALAYAFQDCGKHRVAAELDPRNAASARLLEKLGFTDEGVKRQDFLLGDEICDTQTYGLLASEWRARPQAGPTPSHHTAPVPDPDGHLTRAVTNHPESPVSG